MDDGKRWLAIIVVLVLLIGGWFLLNKKPDSATQPPLTYAPADPESMTVEKIADDMGPVTRLIFTPDGKVMLAGILTGEVYAFRQTDSGWQKQTEPVVTVNTAFPGFPPDENGLAGMTLGADFASSGDIFFAYAYKAGEEDFKNRVARAKLSVTDQKITATDLKDIFEANTPAGHSHQIQGIIGATIANKPHVMFLIGEGFKAERAQDITKEAGKLMLIAADGSNPVGPRPFPAQPKIQAIGIRNAPDLALNPADPLSRLAIVDTGPDQNDRFLYGKFIDLTGKAVKGIDLGWNGTPISLTAGRFDPNVEGNPEPTLYRWDPTHTATNVVFHPGKGIIPASDEKTSSVLVSLFGRTGEIGPDTPGRAIWLGRLSTDTQAKVEWTPLIVRSETGINEVGHPIGLNRNPQTNDLVFADIVEGNIYQAKIKG